MTKLIVIGIFCCVVVALNLYRRQQAIRAEAADGCLACGSAQVELRDAQLLCLECGYAGAADRGGTLTARELDATAISTRFDDPR